MTELRIKRGLADARVPVLSTKLYQSCEGISEGLRTNDGTRKEALSKDWTTGNNVQERPEG